MECERQRSKVASLTDLKHVPGRPTVQQAYINPTAQPFRKWQRALTVEGASSIRQQNICNANELATLQQCPVSQHVEKQRFPIHQHPWSFLPVLWPALRKPVKPVAVRF